MNLLCEKQWSGIFALIVRSKDNMCQTGVESLAQQLTIPLTTCASSVRPWGDATAFRSPSK